VEPTPNSLRSYVAAAIGRGSPPALGDIDKSKTNRQIGGEFPNIFYSDLGGEMGEIGAVFYIALIAFGIALAMAWIVLPFALIGTKPLLRELIAEARKTNEILRQRSNG
jgi:hypothetical protein